MKKVINTLLLLFVLCGILIFLFLKSGFLNLNVNGDSQIILIQKNDNLRRIALKLKVDNIYGHQFLSFFIMKIIIGNDLIHHGEYQILNGETILSFTEKIKNKVRFYRKITFIEGETIETYKKQIENSYGLVDNITEKLEEGYFMPGTYKYLYNETKDSIIRRARNDMVSFVESEFSKSNIDGFYLKNIHEVLTLASVVEKESALKSERKLIAGVFYNRLKQKMKLQTDPTVIYEITRGKFKMLRKLTFNDLKTPGQYNTYYIHGIPIAPICSPSMQSIIAVLNPDKTDYLFFVSNGDGSHNFSSTFEGHKENVKQYRQSLQQKND